MTDREDGQPSRGPRRYGPRSAGEPPPPVTPQPTNADPATRRQPRPPAGPAGSRDHGQSALPGQRAESRPTVERQPSGRPVRRGLLPPTPGSMPASPTTSRRDTDRPTQRSVPQPRGADFPPAARPPRAASSPSRSALGEPAAGPVRRPTGYSEPYPGDQGYRPRRPADPPETERAWSAAPAPTVRPAGTRAAAAPAAPPRDTGPRTGRHERRVAAPQSYQDRPPPAAPAGTPRTDEERRHRRLWISRIAVSVLSVLVLVATGFVSLIADNAGQQEAGLITSCPDTQTCTGKTILLVGSDARVDAEGNPLTPEELEAVSTQLDGGGTSTDTMMLIHIPSGGGTATAVSIPRDSWISTPPPGPSDSSTELVEYSPNKVNSFYGSAKFYTAERMVADGVTDQAAIERESSNAGRKMLISVLEQLTGTHIDDYAEINLFGFYLLSNAIGGVPVCLLNPVNDPFSGANFAAGPQTVQGSSALSFVRQRHGLPNGDLDRVRRQQAFLSGAISKVLSVGTLGNPATLSSLIDAANRSIVLSAGFNLLELAEQMASMSSGNINFETIPTHGPETTTDKDALHIDDAEVKAMFTDIANGTDETATESTGAATDPATTPTPVDPASITVDVQNGTMTSGMAKSTSDLVAEAGYSRGQISDYPGTSEDNEQQSTTIRYSSGSEGAATQVQQALGFGTLQADAEVESGHVLVVVGVDRVDGGGLRAGAVATGQPAFGVAQVSDTDPINAAQPGCVN